MKLASLVTAAVLSLTATAVAADRTVFVTPTGAVKVSISVILPDDNTTGYLAPGDYFYVRATFTNVSKDPVEMIVPTLTLRAPVNGIGTSWNFQHRGTWVIPAGKTRSHQVIMQVPLNVDLGGHVLVGLTVGVATNMNDFRGLFTKIDLKPAPPGPIRRVPEKTLNTRRTN